MHSGFLEGKRRTISLESRRQIHISRNDSSVEQGEHTVGDVVLSDRRWISEGVVSELLWENAFRLVSLLAGTISNTKLLQLDVADASLTASILELIGWSQSKFCSDEIMTVNIFRVAS